MVDLSLGLDMPNQYCLDFKYYAGFRVIFRGKKSETFMIHICSNCMIVLAC